MKARNLMLRILGGLFAPLRVNALFFVFMYVLGVVCSWATQGAKPYAHLYSELFFDLYLLCAVLAVLPAKARLWVRRVLYVFLYGLAVIDVYCYVKFDSTINPTMLLLVNETDPREAGEFLQTFLQPSMLLTSVGWVVLVMAAHAAVALRRHIPWVRKNAARWAKARRRRPVAEAVLGVATAALLACCWADCRANKRAVARLMTAPTIGEVEHILTQRGHGEMYEPPYRLAFSLYANHLANQQIGRLMAATRHVEVDSCSFRSPTIVLIIGESFARNHSQQYGYRMPTTPRQLARERDGSLVRFSDVVAPWNLTSYVFKNVLSMHVVGQKGEWCDYPLFPQVFRRAGYHVTFLTNQFLPKAGEEVYDFSGGFFLNDPELSASEFDTRNDSVHRYDAGLLDDFRRYRKAYTAHNLFIFHLLGQHVSYHDRYPQAQKKFSGADYQWRTELTPSQRSTVADYDNAVLYNDSIVDQIIRLFEQQDAIVVYMPDHGEECYEGSRGIVCRLHSTRIDYDLAHYEFDIPFWVWMSPSYVRLHPDIARAVRAAKDKRFMTDALPHMLLYLAGIHAPYYHDAYNLLSPRYDEARPRILKGYCDYDQLKKKQP